MTKTTDRIVAIQWHDASQLTGYHGIDGVMDALQGKGAIMASVGYLIAESDDYYILAQTRSLYKWGDLLRVPKACVMDINRLAPPDNLDPNWVEERDTEN